MLQREVRVLNSIPRRWTAGLGPLAVARLRGRVAERFASVFSIFLGGEGFVGKVSAEVLPLFSCKEKGEKEAS